MNDVRGVAIRLVTIKDVNVNQWNCEVNTKDMSIDQLGILVVNLELAKQRVLAEVSRQLMGGGQ